MYKKPTIGMCGGTYCCIESPGEGINPLDVAGAVAAGSACASGACGMADGINGEPTCLLATAYMPMQVYRAGFCPNEALMRGTLFPELVDPLCKEAAPWN